ncbi:hypothetical protein [Dysgonomonas sp. ZJ279]|uniref:hypothetical protein n=1 Tax=Dysgonomonas sp. ZJ279 TaxID=2709796 RepID=UPI0013ECEF5F|nr:hypothetical protein [Dysgonomonas sp. ZJ279]
MKYIFIFYSILLFQACSTKSEHQGYIIFIHAGEQDSPVSPYSIICNGDTTHLQYKKMENEYPFSYFINTAGYHPENIDTLDYKDFVMMKNILTRYSLTKDGVNTGQRGSLLVLVGDGLEVLRFIMPSGDSTSLYLEKLISLSNEIGKKNIVSRLNEYKAMQIPQK